MEIPAESSREELLARVRSAEAPLPEFRSGSAVYTVASPARLLGGWRSEPVPILQAPEQMESAHMLPKRHREKVWLKREKFWSALAPQNLLCLV